MSEVDDRRATIVACDFLETEPDQPFLLWVGFSLPYTSEGEKAWSPPNGRASALEMSGRTDSANLSGLDSMAGRILDKMAERPQLDEKTWVVSTNDRGIAFPFAPEPFVSCKAADTRTIQITGEIIRGETSSLLLSKIDFYEFVCDCFGIEPRMRSTSGLYPGNGYVLRISRRSVLAE